MITLTKLNNDRLTLNALYIERIESFPDTTITLVNQKKVFVKESEEEVKKTSNRIFSINWLESTSKRNR